jgi:hypothetical protein
MCAHPGGLAHLVERPVGGRDDSKRETAKDLVELMLALGFDRFAAGLRANPEPPEPLAPPALTPEQMDEVLVASWNARPRRRTNPPPVGQPAERTVAVCPATGGTSPRHVV